MYICIVVLSPVHSAPVFPRTKSEAVKGDYRGCKASVVDLCARNFPLGGFAILSAFQAVDLGFQRGSLVTCHCLRSQFFRGISS